MKDLSFSIKVSCDIFDAWPGAGTGDSGVPQGAEPGPQALAPVDVNCGSDNCG